jgi:putative CocE/NonD family hydrolase
MTDAHWNPYPIQPPLNLRDIEIRALHLALRDGVKIAIDVYLPKNHPQDKPLPAILLGTRYFRRSRYRFPFQNWMWTMTTLAQRNFLANGYAWVSMDARGTGASTGHWAAPWTENEVSDYAEVMDWVTHQPWSDGTLGAVGISYNGTSAEMMAHTKHPALKAVIPMFSLFDLYPDIAHPGGIHLNWFTENWTRGNLSLDTNQVHKDKIFPLFARLLSRGVQPVDDDHDGSQLRAAIAERTNNWNTVHGVTSAPFRGDWLANLPGVTFDDLSPHAHLEAVAESKVAVYSYGGWFDGAYPRACVNRYLSLKNPNRRLTLGAWNHGGSHNSAPAVQSPTQFNHFAEMIRFFDTYIKGIETHLQDEPPIHYYTMVEEKWKSAESWPPPAQTHTLYFQAGNQMTPAAPTANEAADSYQVDYRTGTGNHARWNSLIGGGVVTYADRSAPQPALLTYTSAPLEADTEVTGHPLVRLFLASSATDAQVFVYLEDVTPAGQVHLVTEGQLRAIHRKTSAAPYQTPVPYHSFTRADAQPLIPNETVELVIDLLPTSYLFQRGHCLRVSIAGADKDHFEIPNIPPPLFTIQRNRAQASAIVLPVV